MASKVKSIFHSHGRPVGFKTISSSSQAEGTKLSLFCPTDSLPIREKIREEENI